MRPLAGSAAAGSSRYATPAFIADVKCIRHPEDDNAELQVALGLFAKSLVRKGTVPAVRECGSVSEIERRRLLWYGSTGMMETACFWPLIKAGNRSNPKDDCGITSGSKWEELGEMGGV